jgi:hypothetical protein
MKRNRRIIALFLSVFLVGVSIHLLRAAAQEQAGKSTSGDSRGQRMLAVSIIRYINTAEASCQVKNGKRDENQKFLSWDELLNAPCFEQTRSLVRFYPANQPAFSSGSEIVPGLELRLVVSADGKHYNVSLGEKPTGCGSVFFSDERGVIFEGKALGCEGQKVPGGS